MKRPEHTATPSPSIAAMLGTGLRVGRHRGTTANLASIYPFHGGHNAGERGPFLGVNVTAGGSGWFFDPFELYGRDLGVRIARKHLGWYADEAAVAPALRARMLVAGSAEEVLALVARAFGGAPERRAA